MTDTGLKLVLAGIGVMVVPFLNALGLGGWLGAGLLLVAAGLITSYNDAEEDTETVTRRNCSHCGARNDVRNDECRYCGEALA